MDTISQRSLSARKHMEDASPSRWHGIDAATEQHLRRSYTRFIQRLGKALRLPQQPTIATATILCHRFFFRQSHAKNDSLLIASGCLLLASKSEDTPRRLAHIAGASCNLRFGTKTASDNLFVLENKDLQKDSEHRILLAEHLILCTLGFELEVELPYKPLSAVLRMLKENLVMQKELIKLGERHLKSQQMTKLDQMFDGCAPMDLENSNSASKHINVQHKSIDNMDRHVSAATNVASSYVVTQNNVSGKMAAIGFNHADGSTFAQSRAALEHFENGKYKQSRICPDQADTHVNDYVHTQYSREGEKTFHQVAWNFVNDTLLSLMCMQFKPHQIAAGAVWLAAKFLGIKLPSEGERAWWKEMNVTPLELEEVGNRFLEVYSAEEEANRHNTNPQSVSKSHNFSR